MMLEKCAVCGWVLSVTARGLVCLNAENHEESGDAHIPDERPGSLDHKPPPMPTPSGDTDEG